VDYAVARVEIPPHTLAAVSERVKLSELSERIPGLLGEVWQFIEANKITTTGHNVIVYDGEERAPDGDVILDAFFGVEVRGIFNPTSRVVDASTPGGPSARTIHMGPYNELPRAHDAVRRWCAANGQRMTGANWEVYGDWSDDPTQLRTDVFYQLDHGSRPL
jgi:effector-binding domain-containing protein